MSTWALGVGRDRRVGRRGSLEGEGGFVGGLAV